MYRILFLISFFSHTVFAQHNVDVKKYTISITLNDTNNVISVKENILFNSNSNIVSFDLQSLTENRKGMTIHALSVNGNETEYTHHNDTLLFNLPVSGSESTVSIKYSGIPENGLIISNNRYGKRTFFGDNWPNRAHQWFVCNDHPIDKALIDFSITAPSHYQAVANGTLIRIDSTLATKTYNYSCSQPIPTKVMVVGVADFKSIQLKENPVPIYNYVYTDNPFDALSDLNKSNEPLSYFSSKFGDYPFSELFNVQSTTIFGGMENAGCIFYDENSFTGESKIEPLIAHEIAHQWFGNSASEVDFNHLWLSEGFATYLTHLFLENKYGTEMLKSRLIQDRIRILNFQEKAQRNVVTNNEYPLMSLLNPNAYQKGSFILHMLRNDIGDSLFFESLNEYHTQFKYSNASTDDFFAIIEKNTNEDFDSFKKQWLYSKQYPILQIKKDSKEIHITQKQNQLFEFTIEIEFTYNNGEKEVLKTKVNQKETILLFDKKIDSFKIDPNVKLLFKLVE